MSLQPKNQNFSQEILYGIGEKRMRQNRNNVLDDPALFEKDSAVRREGIKTLGRRIGYTILGTGMLVGAGLLDGSIEPNLPAERPDPAGDVVNLPQPTPENGGLTAEQLQLEEQLKAEHTSANVQQELTLGEDK